MKRDYSLSVYILVVASVISANLGSCKKPEGKPDIVVENKSGAKEGGKQQSPPYCDNITVVADAEKLEKATLTPEEKITLLNRFFSQCLSCGTALPQCADVKKKVKETLTAMDIKEPLQSREFALNLIQIKKKQGRDKVACSLVKAAYNRWKEMERDAMIYCLKDEETKYFIANALSDERKIDGGKALNDINHFEWIILLCNREIFWQPDYCSQAAESYKAYANKYRGVFDAKLYEKVIYVLMTVLNDLQTARSFADEGVRMWGDNIEIAKLAAQVYAALKETEKARKLLEEAVKKAPGKNELKFELAALILEELGNAEESAKVLASITDPSDEEKNLITSYSAWIEVKKGDCKKAIEIMKNCKECRKNLKRQGFVKDIISCQMEHDAEFQKSLKETIKKTKEQ
ncbi:MAG: hypothetical protein Kow0090_03140 [Myxococcota bacterium]